MNNIGLEEWPSRSRGEIVLGEIFTYKLTRDKGKVGMGDEKLQ